MLDINCRSFANSHFTPRGGNRSSVEGGERGSGGARARGVGATEDGAFKGS